MSKTQSAVSHSSTEAEVIALDHAVRVEGLPAMSFWEAVKPLFSRNVSPGGDSESSTKIRESFQEKQAVMRLIVCEDNEAVIKIILKQRSPALRHVSRTHRICLDWTYEIMQNQCVSLKYVNTKFQIADMMTKAFTLSLIHI